MFAPIHWSLILNFGQCLNYITADIHCLIMCMFVSECHKLKTNQIKFCVKAGYYQNKVHIECLCVRAILWQQ